jgi:hypothetical protein
MSGTRVFVESDMEQVAILHWKVFGASPGTPPPLEEYAEYFKTVFLSGPWPYSEFRSLVYEDSQGRVVGFLGVLPVKMVEGDNVLWACVCSQFCVDPMHRGLAGLALVKRHFAGPQDMSFTDEGNLATLKLWRWAGGEPALLYSLHWTRPLRPARLALPILMRRIAMNRFAFLANPIGRLADALLMHVPRSPFSQASPRGSAEEADLATMMVESMPDLTRERAVVPAFDHEALRWLVQRTKVREGSLRTLRVKDDAGKPLGWCAYHLRRESIGDALEIVARPQAMGEVLDHLIHDAYRHGAVVLHGRLDPPFVQEFSDRYCLISRRGPWTLVHARNPKVLQAVHRGEAFLPPMAGEWCIRFR